MLSINYAKKNGDGYVISFYADTVEDITNFDPTKSFGIYGIPQKGSIITLVGGTDSVNYYLGDSGEIVEIEVGGDEPTGGLTSFYNGQTITGVDFGNVQNGDTSSGIASLLTSLAGQYVHDGMYSLLQISDGASGIAGVDGSAYGGTGYMLVIGETVIYSTAVNTAGEGSWQLPFSTTIGFQNIVDGKYTFSRAMEAGTPDQATASTWNGVLFGAVEAE